ncbi:MAG: DUF4173 domain-containing protein [Ruminococcaceae bacterium]|nr:DUF4173 domain-containing protein [Oscillospiraceae bacterium]
MDNNVTWLEENHQSLGAVRKFSKVEIAYAWLCFVIGYGFCKVFSAAENPLGAFLFIVALIITSFVVVKVKKATLGLNAYLVAGSALLMSASMVVTSNATIQFFSYMYCLLAYGYFMYIAFGNQTEKGLSDLILIDFFKILFIVPFMSLGYIFPAAFSSSEKGRGKVVLKVLLGVAIAIIPTVVIVVLLSYDSNFSNIIDKIFADWDVFSDIFCITFGVPVGMYAYGIFFSSVENKTKDIMVAESCRNASMKAKKAPVSTIIAATLPVLIVYIIFFISQWQYYVSGFKGILPVDTIYAEYAREGFFQLCTVSVINFIILIVISMFMCRETAKPSIIQKVLVTVFSVFTLILIATAISKMVLYIDVYGLTQKRIYATWFMLVLTLIFVLLVIKQFVNKVKVIAVSVLVLIVAFGGLAFSNVENIIANYNVERYVSGKTDIIDVESLYELGDAAVPAMIKLAEYYDEKQGTDFTDKKADKDDWVYNRVCNKLYLIASTYKTEETTESIWKITFPRMKAESILADKGLT